MKNRVFVTLFLSTVIALPAFAQQGNSSSSAPVAGPADQNASPSQNATATGKEPLRQTTQKGFWDGDQPGVAWLVLHPFASKGYVQRQTRAIQDRVNELDELTASQAKTTKDVNGRAQQGIQLASDKANEADQHATDAGNKAAAVQETATKTNTRLNTVEGVVSNIDPHKTTNRTEIRFRRGHVLSEDAKRALDEIAAPLKDQHGYVIEVQGFSPGRGQAGIAASREMADSVVRYLVVKHEIPAYRIYVVSMGNALVAGQEGTAATRPSRARVDISVLKNDLDQLASSSGASTPPK